MKMDTSQYLDLFLEESKEHLGELNQKLLDLEKSPQDIATLNDIFRSAHTLKGMSSTMGFDSLADLTHHMEDVLSDLKEGALVADSFVVNTLFQAFDRLQLMIDNIEEENHTAVDNSDLIQILSNIKNNISENVTGAISSPPGQDHKEGFELNEYDLTILKEAGSKGLDVYEMVITLDKTCMMKAVRSYMVIKALEEDGEIIKTIPDSQDIDEGNFDLTFSVLVISKEDQEIIKNKINKIAELTLAKIQKVDYKTLNTPKTDNVSADASPDHDKPLITKDNSNLNKEARKQGKAKQTVRVDIERLDSLMNLVGELVMHKGRIEQIGATLKLPEFNETLEQINRVSSDLQSVVMKVRMVAVETVFNRFPRMVRDLAKELEKDIDFIIEGQDTELDRTVIDELGDPLLHLLRNSLDHGIEPAEVRAAAGKPTKGTVILRARHEGNNVYIEVEDDGGGIIKEGILTKAVEKGLVTSEIANEMSFEETAALLFTSGFSTAKELTDISGRGVGLDVVKTKIESLSGEIFIESKPGIGTKFKIKLPLTLAIIQALMISVGDEYYAIPLSSVDETTIINVNDIKNVHSQEVIMLRGVVLPIYRLADLVSISSDIPEENAFMHVVIVHRGGKQIGLAVDTLIGQQEIVIKSLGKLFQGLPGIAGGFVGRDGRVRLILDVVTLF